MLEFAKASGRRAPVVRTVTPNQNVEDVIWNCISISKVVVLQQIPGIFPVQLLCCGVVIPLTLLVTVNSDPVLSRSKKLK